MKHSGCDYESYDYQGFWPGREYEDLAERRALLQLLPPQGDTLVDIGAGFGRLVDLYRGYGRVVLLDRALSQLRRARAALGPGYVYAEGDIYHLPLANEACEVAMTVRVLHHLQDLPAAVKEIHRILTPGGLYVLEYANKRNLKEIIRYLMGRSKKRPFSTEPVEYMEMHFNFHPSYMESCLREAGFSVVGELAVSHFRLAFLKRLLPPRFLAWLDGLLFRPGAKLKLSPSIFVAARKEVLNLR